jgi:YbbR domain-containing protein
VIGGRAGTVSSDRRTVGARLKGAFVDNAPLKLLAFILALTVYLLVNTDEDRDMPVRVPVVYKTPPDKALVSKPVDQIEIVIRGPYRRIRRFDPREIGWIDLDLTDGRSGEIAITADMIDLPRGLELVEIEPKVVQVAFEDAKVGTVRVEPSFGGRPLSGFRVDRDQVRVDPPEVLVRGAEGLIDALDVVRTQEIRVDGRSDTFPVTVGLVPPEGVEIVGDDLVDVTVAIDELLITQRTDAVPVEVRVPATPMGGPVVDATRWTISPDHVAVSLTGRRDAVEAWLAQGVTASVTLPLPAEGAGKGPVELVVALDQAADHAGVGVRIEPERVTATPK